VGVFRQLGDPVGVGVGVCQHHGEAYEEIGGTEELAGQIISYLLTADGAAIVQVQITITETCCVVVNAAMFQQNIYPTTDYEIERPLGSIRTQQEDYIDTSSVRLFHYASWEVLPAGIYTYYLVNRSGVQRGIYAAWIKIIASDCEG